MSEPSRPRADPRLPAYLIGGFGALIVALAVGEPQAVALAAPLLVLAALGLRDPRPVECGGEIRLSLARVIEGDLVEGEIAVDWDGEAEVDVILAAGRSMVPVEPEPVTGWSLPRGTGPKTLPFTLRARSWGVHDLGAVWVRTRRPGSFLVHERKVAGAPIIRVLPTELRARRLLKPAEPRAVAGMHLSRARERGTDFAELRPYRAGDRLRDLSWATSARLGEPWVRVNHPERTGTVVLVLEAVFSDREASTEALARAARGAWAVASMHLQAQDRVGLLARGRTAAWLPPQGGGRARWMLLEELLSVGRAVQDGSRRRQTKARAHIPSDALIVGVTTLRSQAFPSELLHYRRAGLATVALVIDTSDLVPGSHGPAERAARRIWVARRDVERRILERGGVPTALVPPSGDLGSAIAGLRRRMRPARPVALGGTV